MTKNEQVLSPPRRVIRALYSHTAHQPEELSFSQGDFFHVVGNEEDKDWYEATNPVTGQRGYVPVTFFQVVDKTSSSKHSHSHSHSSHHSHSSRHQQKQRSSNQSLEDSGIDSGSYTDSASPQYSNRSPIGSHSSVHSASLPKCPPLYGVVLYDFAAERPDELESKSNDAILVIAQSNPEWYVAKPIGRLGGPGLIPVSYIEIRDMVTGKAIDVAKYLRETGTAIPRVEEWKKQTMEYKANSIPLGRIDANEAPQHQYPPQQQHPSHQIHPQHQQHQQQQHHHHQQQQQQHATARRQHQSMPQPQPQHHHPKTASHQHPDHHGGHHGPTLQDLKNKVSRDMRSQRNPSQDLRV
ncbi:bud emergence protein 1, partial [Lunasporangiospora selenospora]